MIKGLYFHLKNRHAHFNPPDLVQSRHARPPMSMDMRVSAHVCAQPRPFQALCEFVLSGPVIEVGLRRGGSFSEGICPE